MATSSEKVTKTLQNDNKDTIHITKDDTTITVTTLVKNVVYHKLCDSRLVVFEYKLLCDIFDEKNTSWRLKVRGGMCGPNISFIVTHPAHNTVADYDMELSLRQGNHPEDMVKSLTIRVSKDKTYVDMFADMGTQYSVMIDTNVKLTTNLINDIKNDKHKDFSITHVRHGGEKFSWDEYALRIGYMEGAPDIVLNFKTSRGLCIIL